MQTEPEKKCPQKFDLKCTPMVVSNFLGSHQKNHSNLCRRLYDKQAKLVET